MATLATQGTIIRNIKSLDGFMYVFSNSGVDVFDESDFSLFAFTALLNITGGDVSSNGIFVSTSDAGVYNSSFPPEGSFTLTQIASTTTTPALATNAITDIAAHENCFLATSSGGADYYTGTAIYHYNDSSGASSPAINATHIAYVSASDVTLRHAACHIMETPIANWTLLDGDGTNIPRLLGTWEHVCDNMEFGGEWAQTTGAGGTITFSGSKCTIDADASGGASDNNIQSDYIITGGEDFVLASRIENWSTLATNDTIEVFSFTVAQIIVELRWDGSKMIVRAQSFSGATFGVLGSVDIPGGATWIQIRLTRTNSATANSYLIEYADSTAPDYTTPSGWSSFSTDHSASNMKIQQRVYNDAGAGTISAEFMNSVLSCSDITYASPETDIFSPAIASDTANVIRLGADLFVGTGQGISAWDDASVTEFDESNFGGATADTADFKVSSGATDSAGTIVYANDDRIGVYDIASDTVTIFSQISPSLLDLATDSQSLVHSGDA